MEKIDNKKYCKKHLTFLGARFNFQKVYNQCLAYYGKKVLDQTIEELLKEGKISKTNNKGNNAI